MFMQLLTRDAIDMIPWKEEQYVQGREERNNISLIIPFIHGTR
jgi:hypothetical protein